MAFSGENNNNKNHHHHHHRHLHFHLHLHFPHLIHFHHNHHENSKKDLKDIPKGCLAILVGQGEEQRQRFVIPVIYVNHPLFMHLLKDAEEEYGFDQKGPITIPCHVKEFRTVQGMIDEEKFHHHHYHQHRGYHAWCFKV